MPTELRFCEDADLLRIDSQLDRIYPRVSSSNERIRSWDVQIQLASDEIDRRLRARRDTSDTFNIGSLGLRSRDRLRDCAAYFALHFIYVDADQMGAGDGHLANRARYYWERANSIFEAEANSLDYDLDADGDIEDDEENQPFPNRFIRG